jgi:hypothetical protein
MITVLYYSHRSQLLIYTTAVQPFCWVWAVFSLSRSYTQPVGLLGRGISPPQGLYLHREQHKTE